MSAWHCLVKAEPLHVATGTRYPVFASSAQRREITGLGGEKWEPALTEAPKLAIALFNGDFSDAVTRGAAALPLAMETLKKGYPLADQCSWSGAGVTIYAGRIGDAWPWRVVFKGSVTGFDRKDQTLTLAAEVDTEPFAADVLALTYAGTSGAEGGDDLKDKVKPLVIGHARNVEPVLIDATNSVFQFSGYGPIEEVTTLFERASDFGPELGDYADYAALVAADIAPGLWGTCLAQGMVRLGAPPFGVITGDVKGHVVGTETPRLTGAVIAALAGIAGVDTDLLEQDSLDALDAAVPCPINAVLVDQISFAEAARGLALPCNSQAGISLTGTFFVASLDLTKQAALTLDARGRAAPQVIECGESKTSPPYARMVFGANRNWRVQTPDEIAFEAPLIETGLYDDAKTYREGNIVSLADKSRWLYINTTPTAGNDPPVWPLTSDAYWQNLDPPATASDITYSDGTTLEDLEPAEPGSDITSNIPNVADTVVQCDYAGTPKAGQVNPRYVQFTLVRNGIDETASASWAATPLSGDAAFSMSNTGPTKGRLNITAVTVESKIEIEATFGDRVVTLDHTVRVDADPPPSGGTAGTINGSVTGTTPAAIGAELTITVGPSGTVNLAANYTFSSDQSAGSQSANVQWCKWNGSAYVAIGSAVGSAQSYSPASGEVGLGTCGTSDTGNTVASSQKYTLYGAAGGSYTDYFSGRCSAASS